MHRNRRRFSIAASVGHFSFLIGSYATGAHHTPKAFNQLADVLIYRCARESQGAGCSRNIAPGRQIYRSNFLTPVFTERVTTALVANLALSVLFGAQPLKRFLVNEPHVSAYKRVLQSTPKLADVAGPI